MKFFHYIMNHESKPYEETICKKKQTEYTFDRMQCDSQILELRVHAEGIFLFWIFDIFISFKDDANKCLFRWFAL